MTVYVDDMYLYPMGRYGRMKMSHMISDDEDELHIMADLIGVARKWHQGDHYDIAIEKRVLAVAYGAVEVPMRILAAMMACERTYGHPLPPPHMAVELRRALGAMRRYDFDDDIPF